MSLTQADLHWHERYEAMIEAGGDQEQIATEIGAAFAQCQRTLISGGIEVANDDRAEALVAAITRYVVESRGSA